MNDERTIDELEAAVRRDLWWLEDMIGVCNGKDAHDALDALAAEAREAEKLRRKYTQELQLNLDAAAFAMKVCGCDCGFTRRYGRGGR